MRGPLLCDTLEFACLASGQANVIEVEGLHVHARVFSKRHNVLICFQLLLILLQEVEGARGKSFEYLHGNLHGAVFILEVDEVYCDQAHGKQAHEEHVFQIVWRFVALS